MKLARKCSTSLDSYVNFLVIHNERDTCGPNAMMYIISNIMKVLSVQTVIPLEVVKDIL